MTTDLVCCDIAEGIAVITLNRPAKRNALNAEMIAGIGAAYTRCDLEQRSSCRRAHGSRYGVLCGR